MFFCNDPVFPALFPLHLQIWSGAACILFRNSLLIWFSHPPGWVRSCVVLAVWEGLKVCGEGEGRGGKAEARWGRIQRKSCIRKTLQPGQHFCLGLVQASHCVRVCVNPLELGRGGGFTGGRGVGLPQRNLAVNPSPWDPMSPPLFFSSLTHRHKGMAFCSVESKPSLSRAGTHCSWAKFCSAVFHQRSRNRGHSSRDFWSQRESYLITGLLYDPCKLEVCVVDEVCWIMEFKPSL